MNITCIGSGAFAMAIANLLGKQKRNHIFLWTHDEKIKEKMEKTRTFQDHEKEYPLLSNISITTDLKSAVKKSEIIFVLVSTEFITNIESVLKECNGKKKKILIGTKGMKKEKPFFLTESFKKNLNTSSVHFFCGPNLSSDLLKDVPSSMTFSYSKKREKSLIQNMFPDDVILHFTKSSKPLELASTMKNIYAIGSGIIKQITDSKSLLHTYLSFAYHELFSILNTLFILDQKQIDITGDFFLTGTMEESRNLEFGKTLGNKKESKMFLETHTVEGEENLDTIKTFLLKKDLSTPILDTLFKIIKEEENPKIILETIKKISH